MANEMYVSEWQGISIAPDTAPTDVYRAYYQRLRDNGYCFADSWRREKGYLSGVMERTYRHRSAELGRQARALSVGAGMGVVEEPLLRMGCDIVLQECQEVSFGYLESRGVSFESIISQDLRGIPDASFDIIYLFGVLYIFSPDDLSSTLSEIHRVLRPGGAMVWWEPAPRVTETAFGRLLKRLLGRPKGVLWGWTRTKREHIAVQESAGLRVERIVHSELQPRSRRRPLTIGGYSLPGRQRYALLGASRRPGGRETVRHLPMTEDEE